MSQLRRMAIILAGIVAVATAPVMSVAIASGIASANGCKLNEADAHPCVLQGIDWGAILYGMFVMAWFAIATVPLGALAVLLWIATAIVMYVRYRKQLSAPHV